MPGEKIMDIQTLFNIGIGAVVAAIGWFARTLWDADQKLREDLKQIEVMLPGSYVHKDDFRRELQEIKEMLNKIFDRLDNKADK